MVSIVRHCEDGLAFIEYEVPLDMPAVVSGRYNNKPKPKP